jgi:hypothetical protein
MEDTPSAQPHLSSRDASMSIKAWNAGYAGLKLGEAKFV